MRGIPNPAFWTLWKQGRYREALREPLRPVKPQREQGRLQAFLFGSAEEMKQTFSITAVSAGDFLYDYFRLDPTVMEGIDFSRAEDLSSLFAFSRFAGTVDTTVNTGDIAQIQGYVAERMVAAELQAKGHDVEFPQTSNQAGYDLLVDGQPFQVKNLLSPSGVNEHLEKYPDIPVYVNEELASHFAHHPMVYATQVQHAEVVKATKETLVAGAELTNFEIPYISLFVSTVMQAKKWICDEATLGQAVFGVLSDTASRAVLGTVGQYAVSAAGSLLFGPAGDLVGSGVGAVLGMGQAGKVSAKMKSLLAKKEEAEVIGAVTVLSARVMDQMEQKRHRRQKKLAGMLRHLGISSAGRVLAEEIGQRAEKEELYSAHKKREIQTLLDAVSTGGQSVTDAVPVLLEKVVQTGVHPVHYQRELNALRESLERYRRKL